MTYALVGMGLEVTHTVTNVGADEAPVALGTHPYLCIGDVETSELVITSPGSTQFILDQQKVPIGEGRWMPRPTSAAVAASAT